MAFADDLRREQANANDKEQNTNYILRHIMDAVHNACLHKRGTSVNSISGYIHYYDDWYSLSPETSKQTELWNADKYDLKLLQDLIYSRLVSDGFCGINVQVNEKPNNRFVVKVSLEW